jgi:hypothetical protein
MAPKLRAQRHDLTVNHSHESSVGENSSVSISARQLSPTVWLPSSNVVGCTRNSRMKTTLRALPKRELQKEVLIVLCSAYLRQVLQVQVMCHVHGI